MKVHYRGFKQNRFLLLKYWKWCITKECLRNASIFLKCQTCHFLPLCLSKDPMNKCYLQGVKGLDHSCVCRERWKHTHLMILDYLTHFNPKLWMLNASFKKSRYFMAEHFTLYMIQSCILKSTAGSHISVNVQQWSSVMQVSIADKRIRCDQIRSSSILTVRVPFWSYSVCLSSHGLFFYSIQTHRTWGERG